MQSDDRKAFLGQVFYLNRQIKAKEKRLEWLREIAPGATVRFSPEAKGPANPKNSMVETAALKVVELEEEIASDILRLVEVTKEVESAIRSVESVEYRTVLEMRYLGFMEWDEIASRMGYCLRYVFYVHSRAVRAVKLPAA